MRTRLLALGACVLLHVAVILALLKAADGVFRHGPVHGAPLGDHEIIASIAPPAARQSRPPNPEPQPQSDAQTPPPPVKSTSPLHRPDAAPPAAADAGATASTAATQPDTATPQADAASMDFQRRLLAHIAQFRQYPPTAAYQHLQGEVDIAFVMTRTGAVLNSWVVTSSGYAILDQAAIDTITRAQPLPVIPSSMADPLEIEVPVQFSLPG